jgi:hypothetical protein
MKSDQALPVPRSQVFWAEIAPSEHLVQIYGEENVFLDALDGFVAGGLDANEGVIVIATARHLAALDERLIKHGFSLSIARSRDQYIPLDAAETMAKFMVNGSLDEERFQRLVNSLLLRARGRERRVRAFGEMVALMWEQGMSGATVRLEHLWHSFCLKEGLSLFCAYPRSGFTQNADESIKEICDAHSRVVKG